MPTTSNPRPTILPINPAPERNSPRNRFASRNSTVALALAMLTAATVTGPGCIRVATTPVRAERREEAESALGRLAELSPDQIARFLDQRMDTSLALTDNQQVRVNAINLEHANELHAIAASTDNVRAKVRALRKQNNEHESELKDVLTPDQFTRFLAMKDEMREALKNLRSEK